jgi:DNA-binding protein HU-beta
MNKAQLIDKLSQKTRLTKIQSELVMDAALEIIQKTVSKGEEVKIVGFGTFSSVQRKARKGRNPKTGEVIDIPRSKVPRFKPGKDFKSHLC